MCYVQGHIYTMEDAVEGRIAEASPDQRVYVQPVKKRSSAEFWHMHDTRSAWALASQVTKQRIPTIPTPTPSVIDGRSSTMRAKTQGYRTNVVGGWRFGN